MISTTKRKCTNACLIAISVLLTGALRVQAQERPNVVIIYGDDVGFADVGFNGSEKIPTPNLDRLAAEGLNFTDGHCPASTCSASRFAMLTGVLAHRRNIRVLGPTAPMPITERDYTLPRLFKDAGYATAVIGKWHLGLGARGEATDWNGAVKPGPLEIGFDYAFLLPNTNDRVPCVYLENHHVVNLDPTDPISLGKKIDPRSTEYPDGRENPEAMTYYKSTHGHNQSVINGIGRIGTMFGGEAALWDDETMADEFVSRTRAWLASHMQRSPEQPFFLYFSAQDIHVPRTPHPRFHGKSELTYRGDAMVQFDWSAGEVMKMLDEHGLTEETIVIFSSDNGPVYDDGYDDGTTVRTSTQEVDRGHDGSGPYRGGKYQVYEGGTRVPFIVRWPGRIPAGTTNSLVTQTDFIASFARFLGVTLPAGAAPDSQDCMSALLGKDSNGDSYIVEEARGYALRAGQWKLIRRAGAQRQGTNGASYELYNLVVDIGEQTDVAEQHPELIKRLGAILEKIVQGAGVRETFQAADAPPAAVSRANVSSAATVAVAKDRTDDAESPTPKSPNIIVYMVDDLGWNHLSVSQVTGGTHNDIYHTPNLARLARGGLSFTHAYAQPNCAPTRAAMLSGQYPARVNNDVYVVGHLNRFGRGGISKADARFVGPGQSRDVAVEAVTIAEALRKNGYATAHIGKYHVGGHATDRTLPENAGFDINIGGFRQGHQPVCFASRRNGQWRFREVGRGDFDRYAVPYTETYVANRSLPDELVGARKHISDAVGDAMVDTIEKLAAGSKPFYLQFHTYAVHGPGKLGRPDLKQAASQRDGTKLNERLQEYAGFISSVDENLGRLLSVLEDPNGDGDMSDSIASHTLVLFTSDNGGTHAANDPLKGIKGMFTEGGIRVPLIAYWEGVIPPNRVTDRAVHAIDYYPTCLELAGNGWRPTASGHPLDGESFTHVLRYPELADSREAIFYLFPGYLDRRAQPCVVAIDNYQGERYKLYYTYENTAWELYCLSKDPSETKNIVDANPLVAATLSKKIDDWLRQTHPTWQPKYPLDKMTGRPVGPPPVWTAASDVSEPTG